MSGEEIDKASRAGRDAEPVPTDLTVSERLRGVALAALTVLERSVTGPDNLPPPKAHRVSAALGILSAWARVADIRREVEEDPATIDRALRHPRVRAELERRGWRSS